MQQPRFYVTERLSAHREKTPEGYLLCRDVPISRVGVFDYTSLEAGIPGVAGKVHLARTAAELFRPETMASFEGKPVVIGHGTFPNAENWSEVAQGHTQNVRQGEGDQALMLVADLLIQKQEAIELVESGELVEISCGFDSRIVDDGGGNGHQEDIVGNHVALVKKARCSGCQIGDGYMNEPKPKSWKTALRRLFKDSDEAGFNEALDKLPEEMKDEEPPVPESDPVAERFEKLEQAVAALTEQVAALQQAPKPEGDEAPEEKEAEPNEDEKEASDDEASSVLGDAETICPGMKRPQGDSATGKFSVGLLKRVKRDAIKGSGITAFGDSASLDGGALDMAFRGALEVVKARRNPIANGPRRTGDSAPSRKTNAELNSYFAKHWSVK